MSSTQVEISEVLGELNAMAPAGYAIGLHIQYTTPKFMFQTYSKEWLDYYSQNGLVMSDPMVAWGFEHTGACRWSDLVDPAGVMTKAAEHGMPYGVVCATNESDGLSIAGFARADKEFDDAQIAQIQEIVGRLHQATANQSALSPDTVAQLKKMSVMVTHPGS